jgi:hypothetical protein
MEGRGGHGPPDTETARKGSTRPGAACFFSPLCGSRRNETVVLGRVLPSQTLPRVGDRGNPISPAPCVRAQPSQTLPRAGEWGNPVSLAPCVRAQPSQTLPRAGEWGNPVSPHPSSRAYVHVSIPRTVTPWVQDVAARGVERTTGPGHGATRMLHAPARGFETEQAGASGRSLLPNPGYRARSRARWASWSISSVVAQPTQPSVTETP